MTKMKLFYIFLGMSFMIGYNMFLIQRDQKLFKAYDHACQQLPQSHPDCIHAK